MKDGSRAKKQYVKPKAKKHKAAAIVSGSEDGGCSYYKAFASALSYYH